MNEQELKDAISEMQECRELIGKANMKLNNILTQRKADMQKKLDDAYDRGYKKCLSEHEFDMPCSICDDYERGLNDAWLFASHLVRIADDVTDSIFVSDIGNKGLQVAFNMEYSEARKTYDLYFEKKEGEIRVGDEVKGNSSPWVVTHIYEDLIKGIDAEGDVRASRMESIRKTGRRFDIEPILKEIGR